MDVRSCVSPPKLVFSRSLVNYDLEMITGKFVVFDAPLHV